MLSPPKKGWNRFASKVTSKLGRFSRPGEAISRTTRRFFGRFGTTDRGRRRCCHCKCHYVGGAHNLPEYRVQVNHSYWSNSNNVEERDEKGDEGLEFVEDLGAMEDQAVDERAEEFIAKFHRSLKLERLQHF